MANYKVADILKDLYYYNINNLTEDQILDKYSNTENNSSDRKQTLEIPDILSNINGTHTYKLMSSKDIDWENLFLPHSTVSSKNWGSFDSDRRWPNDTPIHINDVYELMNVIDYLLCSCKDLWNEINKLKYGGGTDIDIWFIGNVNEPENLLSINQLQDDAFKKGNTQDITVTYLNPNNYFTELAQAGFGISTEFNRGTADASDYPIKRQIIITGNKNGITAYVDENLTDNNVNSFKTTKDGLNVTFYGYSLNSSKKIYVYPGFNFDNFINSNNSVPNSFVDTDNKKLKSEKTYCLPEIVSNEYNFDSFKQVYVEFLSSMTQNVNDYILYYLDNDVKNVIHIESSNKASVINTLSNYSSYYNISKLNANGSLNTNIYSGLVTTASYPLLIDFKDEFSFNLKVATPKIDGLFEAKEAIITIYYYKQENSINETIYTIDRNLPILKRDEINESILYTPKRYNIPDDSQTTIEVTADWIADPNNDIKYDDEYMDIPYYGNITNDTEASKLYHYSMLNGTKRIFNNFESASELNEYYNTIANQFLDLSSNKKVVQIYEKILEPYKLLYSLDVNPLIKQEESIDNVAAEVESIIEHNDITLSDYNKVILNHKLDDDYEQIKFDLELRINETSKVKEVSKRIPINLNKVHDPIIHFLNNQDAQYEYNTYFNYYVDFYDATSLSAGGTRSNYLVENIDDFNGNLKTVLTDTLGWDSSKSDMMKMSDVLSYCNIWTREKLNINLNVASKLYDNSSNLTTTELEENTNTIEFSYNSSSPLVNLFGGIYTYDYLTSIEKEINNQTTKIYKYTSFNNASIKVNNDNYTYLYDDKNNTNQSRVRAQSLFNIYNLGKNYSFNGFNKSVHYTYFRNSFINNNQLYVIQHYNLTSNRILTNDGTGKINNSIYDIDENNLTYFLGFKIPQTDYLLKYVNDVDNTNNYYYYDNELLSTMAFDIVKKNYFTHYNSISFNKSNNTATVNSISRNTYNNVNTNNAIYVPISYMVLKQSTFEAPANTQPSNTETHKYDFNNAADVTKYVAFKECWDDDSNVKNIRLHINLSENLYNDPPFFRQSNEAKMNFKINRGEYTGNTLTPSGFSNTIKVTINSEYYLSDIIKISGSSNDIPIGSYWEWNDQKNMYLIKEIYNQKQNFTQSNNMYYINPIAKTTNVVNNYDEIKIFEINKYNFDHTDSTLNKLVINYDLYTFKMNDADIDSLLQENISNNLIRISFPNTNTKNIYGNQNYKTISNITTEGPRVALSLVYRLGNGNNDYTISTTIDGIDYELFVYEYNKNYYRADNNNPLTNYYDIINAFENNNLKTSLQ